MCEAHKMGSLTWSQSPEPAPRPNPRWTCRPSSSRLADWRLHCTRRRRCTSGWRDFLSGGQGDKMWGVCCFNIWWEGCDVKDKVEWWQKCLRTSGSSVYFWWLWNLKNTSHESAMSQRSWALWPTNASIPARLGGGYSSNTSSLCFKSVHLFFFAIFKPSNSPNNFKISPLNPILEPSPTQQFLC